MKNSELKKLVAEYNNLKRRSKNHDVSDYIKQKNPDTKFINLSEGEVDYYTGDGNHSESTREIVKNVTEADVWFVGTPIYN